MIDLESLLSIEFQEVKTGDYTSYKFNLNDSVNIDFSNNVLSLMWNCSVIQDLSHLEHINQLQTLIKLLKSCQIKKQYPITSTN